MSHYPHLLEENFGLFHWSMILTFIFAWEIEEEKHDYCIDPIKLATTFVNRAFKAGSEGEDTNIAPKL